MQFSKKTLLVSLLTVVIFALAITPVLAQPQVKTGLGDVQKQTQYSGQDLVVTVGKIIKLVLGFLGLIALILFIVGGFKWMTSGGNEENISEAKKLMSAAVVGLFIIIIAYAATVFIVDKLSETAGCTPATLKCTSVGTLPTDPGAYATCNADNTWGTPTSCAVNAPFCRFTDIQPAGTTMCTAQ